MSSMLGTGGPVVGLRIDNSLYILIIYFLRSGKCESADSGEALKVSAVEGEWYMEQSEGVDEGIIQLEGGWEVEVE